MYKAGCGKYTHVAGTNGGKMPCGGTLKHLDGTTTHEYCAACSQHVYGELFEQSGVPYVRHNGGSLTVAHAVERSNGAFLLIDGKEAFIRNVQGSAWWAKATVADVKRVAVY
jgi:hypothetical protein